MNWTLIDSNKNEASRGGSSAGDNKDRKYVINCFNRPLIDRLPFSIVMDVNNPQKKDQAKFSFMIDFNMPKNCKAGWWTGTTDGKNSAGFNECPGYTQWKMHCDDWDKWNGNDREFNCWFPYLGTGGDTAPPGSKREIDGGMENEDIVLGGAGEDVEHEGWSEENVPVKTREISSLRCGWRTMFGH
jgi:hypothetical protein